VGKPTISNDSTLHCGRGCPDWGERPCPFPKNWPIISVPFGILFTITMPRLLRGWQKPLHVKHYQFLFGLFTKPSILEYRVFFSKFHLLYRSPLIQLTRCGCTAGRLARSGTSAACCCRHEASGNNTNICGLSAECFCWVLIHYFCSAGPKERTKRSWRACRPSSER